MTGLFFDIGGLLQSYKKEKDIDDHKKSSGVWSITDKGVDFIFNRIAVPSHIIIFNKKFYGYESDINKFKEIAIRTALTDKFDFNELMGFKNLD